MQLFYTIDVEARIRADHPLRQLCERIDTDLLFRWFLDMSPEESCKPSQLAHLGRWKLQQSLELSSAAYNLLRITKLQPT